MVVLGKEGLKEALGRSGDVGLTQTRGGDVGLQGLSFFRAIARRRRLRRVVGSLSRFVGERLKALCKSPGKSAGKGGKKRGLAASGNEAGEKTPDLGANREQRLTGEQSDDGEVETTHSPEAEQQAQRNYRESHEKDERLTEEALENEPIPLGHRQTIRKHFESIRPDAAEVDAVQAQE